MKKEEKFYLLYIIFSTLTSVTCTNTGYFLVMISSSSHCIFTCLIQKAESCEVPCLDGLQNINWTC